MNIGSRCLPNLIGLALARALTFFCRQVPARQPSIIAPAFPICCVRYLHPPKPIVAMEDRVNNKLKVKVQSRVQSLIEAYLNQRDSEMIVDFDDKGRVVDLKPAGMQTK